MLTVSSEQPVVVPRAAPTVPAQVPVVVVAENTFNDPDGIVEHFRDQATILYQDISSPERIRSATERADALVVALHRLSPELIDALDDSVRVIGRAGVGVDTIDLAAAAAKGLTVFNEPRYGVNEVAAHALALLLALQRKLPLSDRFVRDGWSGPFSLAPMKPLDELTVGVIGCGLIGGTLVQMLLPLVGRVLVYDPFIDQSPAGTERVESLDDLLAQSDAVSLHVPLIDETRGLLGRRELSLLPEGAILINVSRGGQVDEAAAAELLESGHLGGGGFDVFEHEPLSTDSPLLRAPNTLLTPHVASYSVRASWRHSAWTVDDAISWLETGNLLHGSIVVAGMR